MAQSQQTGSPGPVCTKKKIPFRSDILGADRGKKKLVCLIEKIRQDQCSKTCIAVPVRCCLFRHRTIVNLYSFKEALIAPELSSSSNQNQNIDLHLKANRLIIL
ncbi:hypothetical protein BpHYR1_038425 [Brachionus plicatilis]|uniref:Uncharacterized protein n=1 Tax=Brachionus plicatilis TaxID=10195 RepID=A0A3M7Q158_BRAPC|nr:hypothetical protein BpHYR1_038425 [Brachionus plicatilis]